MLRDFYLEYIADFFVAIAVLVAATGLTPMLLTSIPAVPMVTPAGAPLKAVVQLSTQMLTATQVTEAATLVPPPEAPEMASGATASIFLAP